MRILVIGPSEKAAIQDLKQRAAKAVIDAAAMMGKDPSVVRELNHDLTIDLPHGFKVVLTRERQPLGLCHHISISVDRPKKLPSFEAVETILMAFGMKPIGQSASLWLEDVTPELAAVNLIQLCEDLPEGTMH